MAEEKNAGATRKDKNSSHLELALNRRHRCAQCLLEGRDCWKLPDEFDVHTEEGVRKLILEQGSWARCVKCQEVATIRRKANEMPGTMLLKSSAGMASLTDS